MSKHTRGPWELEIVGNSDPSGTGHDLWDVMGPNLLVTVAENVHDRDAALIAAAPELYEALELLVALPLAYNMNRIEISCGSHGEAMEIVRKARAALAKANGEGSR